MTFLIVSEDLAEALVDEALARPASDRRSGAAQLLVDGAALTAMTLALVQTPLSGAELARALRRWRDRRNGATARLTLESDAVRIEIDIGPDTDLQAVAQRVVDVLYATKETDLSDRQIPL